MSVRALLVLCVAVLAVHAVQWNSYDNPTQFSSSFNYQLSALPATYNVQNTPWSDTYWPTYQGGIANRWQDAADNYPGFNYTLYTKQQLQSGSVNISILSPAEKYDIINGRYDYPTVHSEWTRCSPSDPTWEGLCHGWSPAAIDFAQPNNTTYTNADGIVVPIGSSDVKAFLIYFLGVFAQDQENPLFLAERCTIDIRTNTSAANVPMCWDVNPGAFHVVIANEIGLNNQAFVGDIDRSYQVWNQPISGYNYTLGRKARPFKGAAPGTAIEQHVNFTMYYSKEEQPWPWAHPALTFSAFYQYWLDIDKSGNILGGSWDTNDWNRLDFMWSEQSPAFYGYWGTMLSTVYNSSVANTTSSPRTRREVSINTYRGAKHVTVGDDISMMGYDDNTHKSWIVKNPSKTGSMILRFRSIDTRRHRDLVRVYELSPSMEIGPVIAVVHGTQLPGDIVVGPGKSMLVSFDVKRAAGKMVKGNPGTGFVASVLKA